jgi:hypothetical protein
MGINTVLVRSSFSQNLLFMIRRLCHLDAVPKHSSQKPGPYNIQIYILVDQVSKDGGKSH